MTRRYRKGDTYRPPTAAESADIADAIEGFRSRPERPQDRVAVGQTIVVKTPAAGIDARVGTAISSAVCTRCIETSEADEKTLKETDEEIVVFNFDTVAVSGSTYIKTDLTASGTRYAEICSCGGVECTNCESDLAPLEWAVTLDGIANQPCTDCVDMNQTYILSKIGGVDSCQWRISGVEPIDYCVPYREFPTRSMAILLRVFKDGIDYKIRVELYQESPQIIFLTFEKNYSTTKPVCTSFTAESLPWVSSQSVWNGCESLTGVATCSIGGA